LSAARSIVLPASVDECLIQTNLCCKTMPMRVAVRWQSANLSFEQMSLNMHMQHLHPLRHPKLFSIGVTMAASDSSKPVYKLEELQQHTTDKSCWLAVGGKVYDVTDFLEEHPGGYDIILTSTGARAA
jgi:cytochrome b involved in lipid metabolism